VSRPSFGKIRASFETLEKREVFSAGAVSCGIQIPTDNDVMLHAAAEPSAYISQTESEMLNLCSASQSTATPTGTVAFVQRETGAALDAMFEEIGMQRGGSSPEATIPVEFRGTWKAGHPTESATFGPQAPRAGSLAGVTLPDKAEVVARWITDDHCGLRVGDVYKVDPDHSGVSLTHDAEFEKWATRSGFGSAVSTGREMWAVAPKSGPSAIWIDDATFLPNLSHPQQG
jgi:hypothetical protein